MTRKIAALAAVLAACGLAPVLAAGAALVLAVPESAPDLAVWQPGFAAASSVHLVIERGVPAALAPHNAGSPRWDVAELPAPRLATDCAAGRLAPIDWPAIGGTAHYLPQAVSKCGVGARFDETLLAWDRSKLHPPLLPSAAPAKTAATAEAAPVPDWSAFWDIARYPGRRGLRQTARGTLEIALLADGVALGDVYATLGSKTGIDRAFHKLDQLRPYIVWWQDGGQAEKLLTGGKVLMTSAPIAALAMEHQALPPQIGVQFQAGLISVQSWALAAESRHLPQAQAFLRFAGDDARAAQAALAQAKAGLALPPMTPGAAKLLATADPQAAQQAAAHLAAALILDEAFWAQNNARLEALFQAWLHP